MMPVKFDRAAMAHATGENLAVVYALLAQLEVQERIAVALEEFVALIQEEAEQHANQLPCNEMGGGSAGLDTADDFAVHCNKPDKHDGSHSYEESELCFRALRQMPGEPGPSRCAMKAYHEGSCGEKVV